MAKSDKQKTQTKKQAGASDDSGPLARALVICCLLLAFLGLVWAGASVGWRKICSMEEFQVYPGKLNLPDVHWMDSSALMDDFRESDPTGLLSARTSFFRHNLARDVAFAYSESPWVREVVSVRRRFPNSLEIRLKIRVPYAVVGFGDTAVILDEDGVVLSPDIYRIPPGGPGRPLIVLNETPRQRPVVGEVWRAEEAAGALRMLNLMDESPVFAHLNVNRVIVRREGQFMREGRLNLVLRTVRGLEIRWGLPPGEDEVGATEVSSAAKKRALTYLLQSPTIDMSQFEYIDIRWDNPVYKPRKS